MSDVVIQPIKIMERKFNFDFLDRCLSCCLFFFSTLCCLSFNLQLLITPLVSSNFFLKPWWLIPSKQQNGSGLGDGHTSGFSEVYVAQSFFSVCSLLSTFFFYCFPFLLFRLAIVLFIFHFYGLWLLLCCLQNIHNIYINCPFFFLTVRNQKTTYKTKQWSIVQRIQEVRVSNI